MIVAIIVVLILVLFVLSTAAIAYKIVFFTPAKGQNEAKTMPKGEQYDNVYPQMISLIDELVQNKCERVCTTSHDGIRLTASYYHQNDGAPLVIAFHGYRGVASRDFCGGSKIGREAGFNLLLIDQRGHGESQGHTITFGVKERFDCLDWVNYAVERFGKDTKIILSGVSMGGATVLMASGLNLPKNVKCIVSDCAFSSPKGIITKVIRDMKLPVCLVYPFVRLGAVVYGHFDPNSVTAFEEIKKCKIPVLLIHGEDDRFVPCEMAKQLFEACQSEKMLVTFPNAGHGLSYITDGEKYTTTALTFMQSAVL